MSKEKNEGATYYLIVKHHYQKLRARLMNLAEASKDDEESRKALKGIFHDYINQAHLETQEELKAFFDELGLIKSDELPPTGSLNCSVNDPTKDIDWIKADGDK